MVLSRKRICGLCEMCQKGFPNLCDEMPDQRTFPRIPGKLLGLGTFNTAT